MSDPFDLSQIIVANIVLSKINSLPKSAIQYHILPYLLNQGRILFKTVIEELNLIFSEEFNTTVADYWNLPPVYFLSIADQIDKKELLYITNIFDRARLNKTLNNVKLQTTNKRKAADQLLNNTLLDHNKHPKKRRN